MKRISLAAFARNHKLSRQAAAKWKASGHLVMADGLVCVEESNKLLEAAGLGRYASSRRPQKSRSAVDKSANLSTYQRDAAGLAIDELKDGAEELGMGDLTRFLDDIRLGRTATLAEAATIKENALALKHTLQAMLLQGHLIDRAGAEAEVFEFFHGCRDAWLNFPSRVGPLIAAELGIDADKLVEALSAHVHQQLTDLSEPEADFLRTDAAREAQESRFER